MIEKRNRTRIIIAAVAAVIVLAVIVTVVFFVSNRKNAGKMADSEGVTEQEKEDEDQEDISAEGETDDLPITDEDPQEILQQGKTEENGASVDISQGLSKNENETPDEVGADVEALMKFTAVEEQVTAKEETNLRDKPSQGSDSTVLFVLKNGETATRTGKSDSGWSRLVFNGKTCYAVSNYLTTDLSYKPPQETEDDGIKTKFTSVNEQVTAKEAVNLRLKPSVDDTIAPVVVQIKNGDVVTRTGINTEVGWSRVDYNGQTPYCISSFLMLAE